MIKDVKTLSTSDLLQLRESYRADVRELDGSNFRIIFITSTISVGVITAGTALKNPDFMVFFFVGVAIANCLAIVMLLKNRISVLEKTWYVCYLESKLPQEYRQFSSFGFSHFDCPWPKGIAYASMIGIHRMLTVMGFIWAFASMVLFREFSQYLLVDFLTSILGAELGNLQINVYALDYLFWLIMLIIFGILTYIWNLRIKSSYKKIWKNSIWATKPHLLQKIKKRFECNNAKRQKEKKSG